MTFCLTIVAPQHYSDFEARCKTALAEYDISFLDINMLSKDKAIDFFTQDHIGEKLDKLRTMLKCDVFIQQHIPETRPKKLLLSDMDATILAEETLDELARNIGLKDKIATITDATMRGELNFEDSIKQRVAMLKGLPITALAQTAQNLTHNKGAATLVKTLNAHNVHTVLVSGGFTFFTKYVSEHIGFKEHFGNNLGQQNDHLDGTVLPPILGREAKASILRQKIQELGITAAQSCCIGDGANDLDMLEHAQSNGGLGVGYYPKTLLKEQLENIIVYGDLTTLLYAQGYKEEEIYHAT